MVTQLNIQDAKAKLSDLVARAQRGEDVVIARSGVPAVRLVPVAARGQRELGFMPYPGEVSEEALEPLDAEHLADWYGA
ncbi:MAG: type II toxin-antitoxin system prevent-host-death family antitoxin [Bifidobacteriaceae bacterium]|jgi:prevent-host-death family protein|nr:type II toxin-antitoxin system prevent-host-death family antitoxin [Bifidobacteriaceae bacterium]